MTKQHSIWHRRRALLGLAFAAIGLLASIAAPGLVIGASNQEVVAYCAQDRVYAEPILGEFERETGIKVKPVFDSEAVKTVGLANRLLAERRNPRCDVFWGNEEMRTRQLAAQDVFREKDGWAAFGYRTRRMVINTNKMSAADAPSGLLDLAKPEWKGKFALAYPHFGTTATHFHALRPHWGDERWRKWCQEIVASKPLLLDGNSSVVKMVGRGEAALGLTDSDDISAGLRQGLPIAALPLTPDTLFIPNTVAVIRNAPHPDAAQRLFQFLQRETTAAKLVRVQALEGAVKPPTAGLQPKWDELLSHLEATTAELRQLFLR